jgi:bifunctional DNA-binding transcriptional regulator/antitoxin component of YhaV-PrlF toxin-antitoxin module
MSDNKSWVARVVEDGDDLALVFPPEMLEELGWGEGDTIVWDIDDTNKGILARKAKPDELD